MSNAILKMSHITKLFSGVRALDDVSFELERGEIHAICGENGAGKSTLIKILTGAHNCTSGSFSFDGAEYTSMTTQHAKAIGIRAIYQELSLIPYLTVAENLFLGQEMLQKNRIFRDTKTMNEKTKALFEQFGMEIDPTKKIKEFGIAQQQLIEIMKGISEKAKMYIMDEPTAALTVKETDLFFNIIAKLKKEGASIIFISHRLEEVFEICDRVSVFCDGRKVITTEVDKVDRNQLIKYMVGRELGKDFPALQEPSDEVVFSAKDICMKNRLYNVSLNLHRGEILGIGGLVGAGRTETVQAIYGAMLPDAGEFTLMGKRYKPSSPAHALKCGIGLIPEDRKGEGLLLIRSVNDNICVSIYDKLRRAGVFISAKGEAKVSDDYISRLHIKTPSRKQQVKNLSGGNQQKVVLAKILACNCDILIFDEPTRGIDVGAKQEIYQLMCELTKQGKSIIMVSSDMPELIGMSNRVVVMSNGYSVAELHRDELSQIAILEYASSKL